MRKLCLSLLLSLVWLCACAQNSPITFKHLSFKEGLSQSPIFSMMQDKAGFIWIGSRNGLTRYDGYEFKVYQNEQLNQSISQRDITAIVEDDNSNLWLTTSGGLYQFVRKTESFIHVAIPNVKFTSLLYPAGNNQFWIATDKGVKVLDGATKKVKNFISHKQSGLYVHTLLKDNKGILWASSVTGISCYDANTGKPVPVPAALANQLNAPAKRIFSIQQDHDGDIWIGTESSGLFWYQQATGRCINFTRTGNSRNSLLSDFVKDIFVNADGQLWVGTRNGLSIFNKQTQTFSNYEHRTDVKGSLSNNTIWKIIKDRTGSVWVATYAGGLNVYNPIHNNFNAINERIGKGFGLNIPVVTALIGDADGSIWAGTDGGGINYINTVKGISKYYSVQDFAAHKNSNIVKGLARDAQGNLWIATLDGLATFQPSTGTVKYVDLGTGGSFRANGVLCTDKGIWVAGDIAGLILRNWDGNTKRYVASPGKNSISNDHINCLLEDAEKKGLWIGTPKGLCYLNYITQQITVYNDANKDHRSNVVISLYRDSKQRLWLGTQLGLRLFGKNSLAITKAEGLADNTVQAVTEDVKGNLWVSTSNGISKINLGKQLQPSAGKNLEIANYTAMDGLSSNLWMPNSVFKASDSTLYWGGVNGINSFNPANIIKNTTTPAIVITEFLIKNEAVSINTKNTPLKQSIESTHSIVLKYNQNSFSFKFSALNYINPQKNSYAYKMDGLYYNHNWNYTGAQRIATYTELEPGTYSFKVKAANNDGVWNNIPYVINITILPPFWATWWAYTLYALLVLVVLYYIIRFFRRQAKLERDLFHEHFQLERQRELHQMKLDFFTNISHELRTPLTLIAAPVEKLVTETNDNLHLNKRLRSIQSNTNRLLKLINELMDFRKTETGNMKLDIQQVDLNDFAQQTFNNFIELAQVKNISYSFAGLNEQVQVYFDPNQIDKVLFNLLSNAFKFTLLGGAITLKLTETTNAVHIHVIDNGTGIPFEDQEGLFTSFYQGGQHNPKHIGTGIGLAFSKSIVDLHQGNITFISNPAGAPGTQQTEFTVSLLKGTSHLSGVKFNTFTGLDVNRDAPVQEGDQITATEPLSEIPNEAKQSVLVVEDNDEVRDFIMESLRLQYTVTGYQNGFKGYEAAVVEIPDLIITDVMMPEMDGLELCTKLKADDRTSHIPVIMLTARAADVHQISGLQTGADAYVAKPFSLEILQLKIRNLLSTRQAMQKKFSQQVTLQPRDVVITSNDGKYLTKLMDIIEANLDNADFGVAQLAVEIGMSQPVLYRKIKALSDLSVADFIKSIRLKKAALLLAQNKMSIADVAFAVGFNNRKHFSKEFRKQFNESPTEYIARTTGIKVPEEAETNN